MKFLHLGDLHLGRRLEEFSLLDDQIHILQQICNIAEKEQVDAVLIAGDVYDRAIPPTEAVELLDQFLVKLSSLKLPVYLISGNHDSSQRLSFAHSFLEDSGLFIAPSYQGNVPPLTLEKNGEQVDIFLLPFLKPIHVRPFFPEEDVTNYTKALELAISQMPRNPERFSILVTHQFVTNGVPCESEEKSVGGSDNVDASVFEGFQYVALGHLHSPQTAGKPHIRYSGSPLKYSFSEVNQKKSVTILDTKAAELTYTVPLVPLRDMQELKGKFHQLIAPEFYETQEQNNFFRFILEDEEQILDVMAKLRKIYPNVLKIQYLNTRSLSESKLTPPMPSQNLRPEEIFAQLYREQNGKDCSEKQKDYILSLVERIWKEGAV